MSTHGAAPQAHRPARLLIAGASDGTAVGASLGRAAAQLALPAELADTASAFRAPRLVRMASWRLLGRRPPRLGAFGDEVIRRSAGFGPDVLVATGIAPLSARVLAHLGDAGVRRINFLTDDPWNPAHRAPWFLDALPHYDCVFTPRRANMGELRAAGCRDVQFLPFAYDPSIFHPPSPQELARMPRDHADVVFAGGADPDRVPYFDALAAAGLRIALYGGYWERHARLRSFYRGHAAPGQVRLALAAAKVGVCLVRRANRDGHCMRTFEVPAVGTCMLAEDTQEHRELFGPEGQRVLYFATVAEMVAKCRELCADEALRLRLASAAHRAVLEGGHTWGHRLARMLPENQRDGQA